MTFQLERGFSGFSVEESWIFGDFLKGFNCCCTQMQNVGALLTITAMAADRFELIPVMLISYMIV